MTIILVRSYGQEAGLQLNLRSSSPGSCREDRKEVGSAWELRIGPENRFRIFYKADRELWTVHILAIGVKIKERLHIGGKEFEL